MYPAGTCRSASDVTLTCPEKWTPNGIVTLTCTIDRAKLKSGACTPLEIAEFRVKRVGEDKFTRSCVVLKYFDANCAGKVNSGGCGCTEAKEGLYVLQYSLKADKNTLENSSWSCVQVCLGRNGLTQSSNDACKKVVFGEFVTIIIKNIIITIIINNNNGNNNRDTDHEGNRNNNYVHQEFIIIIISNNNNNGNNNRDIHHKSNRNNNCMHQEFIIIIIIISNNNNGNNNHIRR
nr:hypothetical protein BaRGS_025859 [Batillaria attramentaria]